MKHGENHYGNNNHVNMDKTDKMIRQDTVTDAAVHDRRVLEEVRLTQEAGRDVWADSASRSTEIEPHLKATGLRSKTHRKGNRYEPLTAQQKTHNRCRWRMRVHTEQVSGHQVTAMSGNWIRTVRLVRAQIKLGMKSLPDNFHWFRLFTVPRKTQNQEFLEVPLKYRSVYRFGGSPPIIQSSQSS